jgi:ABC-type thiamin/hydroxymethylpyrimidine transport system permease subunit
MEHSGAIDVVKPFAWLAGVAFLVGFVCYLVLGQPTQAVAQEEPAAHASSLVSGPASDEWNLPKHI